MREMIEKRFWKLTLMIDSSFDLPSGRYLDRLEVVFKIGQQVWNPERSRHVCSLE